MKLAIISNSAFSLLNFRGPLLREMTKCGHEVMAIAPDYDDETRSSIAALGVHTADFSMSRSGTNPLREVVTILQLRRLLLSFRPDVCLSYFWKPVIYGNIAAWMARVPGRYGLIAGMGYAFTKDSTLQLRRWFLKKTLSLLSQFTVRRMSYLLFQNQDDLLEAVDLGMVCREKAVVVGATGVDLEYWKVEEFPLGSITFILMARLIRDKGIMEYLRAARFIKCKYPQTRFLLLGKPDENPAGLAANEIEAWVGEGVIEWPGHVSVRTWLMQSHVFVLPSYYREGVPRSAQEAMAMGRPVITTNLPGCRETVVEGRNGFFVPARDFRALAEAMRNFIENPALIKKMGRESRTIAESKFDASAQNRKLLQILEDRRGHDLWNTASSIHG